MIDKFTDKQLEAARRLRINEDFKILVEYLEDQERKLQVKASNVDETVMLRRVQGASKTVTKLLGNLDDDRKGSA